MSAIESIDICSLNTVEKLGLMDRLWADLAKHPDEIATPDWHLKELQDAEVAIEHGTDEFIDLDLFEAELNEKIKERKN